MKAHFFTTAALMLMLVCSCIPREWKGRMDAFLSETEVPQLLQVRCGSASRAWVFLYDRSDSAWRLRASGAAFIGRCGIGKTKEGDAMTPEGDFPVGTAFGRLPSPDTRLPYLQLRPGLIACDSEGPWYNCIVDTLGTGIRCSGEDMYAIAPEYDYGLEIGYNRERQYPLGSAIFLHCKGEKKYTGGCVAVDKSLMVRILELAEPGMLVSIHPRR